jgi:hypothetical protein
MYTFFNPNAPFPTWQQFLKRPDNIGLNVMQAKQKYLTEQTNYYRMIPPTPSFAAAVAGAGSISTDTTPSLLLDSSVVRTDLVAAYSLRKLRTAYTGSAIQIQSGSSGPTLDVGFDADGYLDTESINTFNTNNDLLVLEKWYDQSGNVNDSDGNSTTRRLQITDSNGNFFTGSNGEIRFRINETSRGSQWVTGLTSVFPASGSFTVFGVHFNEQTSYQNQEILYAADASGNGFLQLRSNLHTGLIENRQAQMAGMPAVNVMTSGTVQTKQNTFNQITFIGNQNPGTTSLIHNGVVCETTTTFTIPAINVFYFPDPQGTAIADDPTEFLLYNADKASLRDTIESNQNDFYSMNQD